MSKKKDNEEIVRKLQKENEELKRSNKVLRKRIRNLQKTSPRPKQSLAETEEMKKERELNEEECCQKCGKGTIKEIRIADRRFKSCTICDFRSTTKIVSNSGS